MSGRSPKEAIPYPGLRSLPCGLEFHRAAKKAGTHNPINIAMMNRT